jgi:hypothetical protein
MSHRFTGKAASAAIASETTSEPQNKMVPSPASIAPGITRMIRLSTISMTVMDAVSEANAKRAACASGTPDLSGMPQRSTFP